MERYLGIVLTSFFLVNIALTANANANANTAIPANKDELNTWFSTVVKPVSENNGTLEPNVVQAESGGVETIDVRQDGSGKFKTISDAVKKVKVGNTKRVVITIGPGEYREKITIERLHPYITFYGIDPNNRPVITFAGTTAAYGTSDSATLIVESDYFVATNIIVSNSAPRPDGTKKGAQGTAMRISGDKAAFYNCKFIGFQNTLYDDAGKHFFKDSYVEGTIDFIYGEAKSLYLNTELHVLSGDPAGAITAHVRRNQDDDSGFSFVLSQITGTGTQVFLGRAWFEAARTVFSYCTIGDVVKPEGWSDNSKKEFQQTVYFGEFQNSGAGASPNKRVPYSKQLTQAEASQFISLDYIEASKWLLPPRMV